MSKIPDMQLPREIEKEVLRNFLFFCKGRSLTCNYFGQVIDLYAGLSALSACIIKELDQIEDFPSATFDCLEPKHREDK